MTELEFGTPVRLAALVERYLIDESGVRESGQRKNLGRYGHAPSPYTLDGWPGEPVPLDAGTPVDDRFELEPAKPDYEALRHRGVRRLGRSEAHVRWRRLTPGVYAQGGAVPAWLGLVVGLTVRHEGVIIPGGGGEEPWPPGWHSERRIELVEVVLRSPDLRCRARMALALPRDVGVVLESPLA